MTLAVDRRSIRAEEQRKVRREEIAQVAQRLFATKGYQATSVADVIEAAGVSRGTFYTYFESRDALFYELIDGFIEKLTACVERVDLERGTPVKDLYANIKRVVDLFFKHRYLTVILLREAIGLDATVHRKLNQFHAFLHKMVTGALANGMKWKLIRKVNEPVVAMAIIGSIKEVLYQYLVAGTEETLDAETIAKELLDFGLRGLNLSMPVTNGEMSISPS
ncbi:MAG TPA: TetR/AcrR family transcriptional regulator [Bdellovibrionota bacterium]|nr:TetR/AcrR family transcriptional regulator [Bdellovibrionota bacterium]